MIDIEEEEKLDVADHLIIENVFPEDHCVFGVQADLLQAVPLHEVLTVFEDKIILCGMKPLLNSDGNIQLFMIAYGTPTGEQADADEEQKS